jgi:SAM-dependent methyltransferase
MKLEIDAIIHFIVCPKCKASLKIILNNNIICDGCGEEYPWNGESWDLIPSSWANSSDLWSAWEEVQRNGMVSYTNDPQHNLGVGERTDYLNFGKFCNFDGLVLDVGCGPQPWPAHFKFHSNQTVFIGIDPLVGLSKADYIKFRALAEYLPFKNNVFDHVVFATSLDHFVDPLPPLKEAVRVCKVTGEIDIWIGEKCSDAPKPDFSPEWYNKLKKPDNAEDVFHLRRLDNSRILFFIQELGLNIVYNESHIVDQYRKNYFYKLKATNL